MEVQHADRPSTSFIFYGKYCIIGLPLQHFKPKFKKNFSLKAPVYEREGGWTWRGSVSDTFGRLDVDGL